MKRFMSLVLVLVLMLSLCVVGCTKDEPKESTPVESKPVESTPVESKPAEPVYDKVTLRLGSPASMGSLGVEMLQWFCDEVGARSGGNVTIECYPNNELYNASELPEAVMNGAIDMAHCTTSSTWPDYCPVFDYTGAWFLWLNTDHVYENLQDYKDLLIPLWNDMGVKALCLVDQGEGGFITTKPIRSVEDMKGLMLRGAGTTDFGAMETLGATPVQMSAGEVYDAVEKGAVDGMRSNYTTMINRKLGDICKYYLPSVSITIFGIIMNQDRWESLSADTQNLIQEVALEYEEKTFVEMMAEDGVMMDKLSAQCETYILTDEDIVAFKEALKPTYDDIAAKCEAAGFKAESDKFLEIAARG